LKSALLRIRGGGVPALPWAQHDKTDTGEHEQRGSRSTHDEQVGARTPTTGGGRWHGADHVSQSLLSMPDLLVHLGGEPAVLGGGKRLLAQDIDDLVGGGTMSGFFGQTAGQQVLQSTFGQRTQIGFLVDDAV